MEKPDQLICFNFENLSMPPIFNISNKPEFAFCLGSHKYSVSKEVASALSPIVSMILLGDPFFDNFDLNIEDSNSLFPLVISLIQGQKVKIEQSHYDFLFEVSVRLGNTELSDLFLPQIDIEKNPDQLFIRIYKKQNTSLNLNKEIEIVAKNIRYFKPIDFEKVNLEVLRNIFSHPNFQHEDEDSIYKLIKEIVNLRGKEFQSLYEFVQLAYLDSKLCIELMNEIDVSKLSGGIFAAIRDRFTIIHDHLPPNETRHKKK